MRAGLRARRVVAAGVVGPWLALLVAMAAGDTTAAPYKCRVQTAPGSTRELVVDARSTRAAQALAGDAMGLRARVAADISCAAVRIPAPPRSDASAMRPVDIEPRSHRWRGNGVAGQELLPGETPQQCIARLRIPADERLTRLCRPGSVP